MAGSEYAKPRIPGRSQPQVDHRPSFGSSAQGFSAATPEIGKSPGYQFFDRKVIPPQRQPDYRKFLQDPEGGRGVLDFLKQETIQSVEHDYEASPSSQTVVLERTEPILVEGFTRLPWSRDLGDHEIRLMVEYTVDARGDELTFHITLFITVTSLDRKRPKFQQLTVDHTFDHRAFGKAGKKKWKASGDGKPPHVG